MDLVSIPANPVPEGAVTGTLKTKDGVNLRFTRWHPPPGRKGTVVLMQGRAEFIEKYFETVRDLRARGFAVAMIDWRGQGHFRALTEQQEFWAIEQGFDEIVVKTKNKFYEMRGTLDNLHFQVIKYERNEADNAESKVYLSKKLVPELLSRHRGNRTVTQATI